MEVLEMLAMSGADLNAKNKNEETPSGKFLASYHKVYFFLNYVSKIFYLKCS